MHDDLYRKIQRQLDRYSIGFPETESGVEIDILKFLFSREDAMLFSQMTDELENPADIARRIGRSDKDVAQQLERMAGKGLLYRIRKDHGVTYCAAPFLHGLLEFQAYDMPRELVALTGKYINEKLKNNLAGASGMRVLPVQESLDAQHRVTTSDEVFEILRNEELIVVADCACRLQYKQFDRACDATMEACIMLGHMAQYYLDNRMGRRINIEEALGIIDKCRAEGLVTQTPVMKRPVMICSCCKCCCGILGSVRRTAKPAELVVSNHQSRVIPENCSGCEACIDHCLVEAISMNTADAAVIDPDRCIGCGLCISACPDEALTLVPRSEKGLYAKTSIKSAFSYYDFEA